MKPRVLFLSTANAARSQMAEAFLRKYAGDSMEIYSAGLEPTTINPYTRQVMQEVGVSMEGQSAKDVNEYMGKLHFGYLITVCGDADKNCPTTFPGISERLHWDFESINSFDGPEQAKLAKFRLMRDQVDERVRTWLQELQTQSLAPQSQ